MIVHLVFIAFNHRANLLPVEYLKMDRDRQSSYLFHFLELIEGKSAAWINLFLALYLML